jgi:TRAP transporter 4TM/12TM fusion protein
LRQLKGYKNKMVNIIAIVFALFFIYAIYATLPYNITRPLYICFSFTLVFCLYPATSKSPKDTITAIDFLLVIITIAVTCFFIYSYQHFYSVKSGVFRPVDIFVGTVAILLSIEACRRVLGWSLPILAAISLFYAMFGNLIPGTLGHRGYSYSRVMTQVFGFEGIYGSITGTYSTYVLLFVIFGAIISVTGMSELLMDISNCLVGRLKGGIAKTAIISSALVGTVMGSGAANVAVTGAFTIPMMKKAGYPAHLAGAIETVASAGGVLMPPIMGSAAFLLATFTGVPYREVALYSFMPAILFYWGIFVQVHYMSCRLDIPQAEKTDSIGKVLKTRGYLLIPVLLIFILIFCGLNAYRAALWAIGVTVVISYILPSNRVPIKQMLLAFGDGAKNSLAVGASAGIIGIILVSLVLPGLPLKLSSWAVMISNGNLFIMLLLMIVVSYIFGMGLPMVASYIILSIIAVPALIEIGLPVFVSHLIIMWFSLAALWTPPVAVGAFVASGIAGASPNKIGFASVRLGVALYVIPFLMAYGKIINGTVWEIFASAFFVGVALASFAAFIEGFTKRSVLLYERIIYAAAAVLLTIPSIYTRIFGLVLYIIIHYWPNRKKVDTVKSASV